MSVEVKATFVYLIPRYNYRQTGYRWLLGAATSCVFERDGDGESEIRVEERERKKGNVEACSVARGEDGGSPFGKQFSYDEWTE